jgi:predicted amidohydrolase YtcJ
MSDTQLILGRVVPMTPSGDEAEAVLVRGADIVAVGSREDLTGLAGEDAKVHDFGERLVLPAFIDPHAHFAASSLARETLVDCRIPLCRTIDDILGQLSANKQKAERNGWLIGSCGLFIDQRLAEKRFPHREELDRVSDTIPIALRTGGHATVLNSAALKELDLDNRTDIFEGAEIDKDTGVIREIEYVVPMPALDADETRHVLRQGSRELFLSNGVTLVGEISEDLDSVMAVDEMSAAGDFPMRIGHYLWVPSIMSLDEAIKPGAVPLTAGAERQWVAGIKMFVDGGYSSSTSAVKTPFQEPYCVPGHEHGKIGMTKDELTDVIERSIAAGLTVALHSNGERAQELVCEAVSEAGVDGSKVRVEHAGNYITEEATVNAWRRAEIVPVPQPKFLNEFGGLLPERLGEPGTRGRFPFKSLLEQGWHISASSDIYIGANDECANPLFSAWCSVARRSPQDASIESEEAVSVMDALRMSTVHAAETMGVADRRGTLEPGKQADVIVLDRDVFAVDMDDIKEVKVDSVFVDGQNVHERGEVAAG